MNPAPRNPAATVLVAGAGTDLDLALLRQLVAEGWRAILIDRDAGRLERAAALVGPSLATRQVDAEDEDAVRALFAWIAADCPRLDLVVWTQGAAPGTDSLETAGDIFERAWRAGCLGAFQVGREAVRGMLPHGQGAIVFVGEASTEEAGIAASSARSALRALAQSMARELWPQGLHVAHVTVDGGAEAGSAAETILAIPRQARNAWTFALDIHAGASAG